MISAHEKEQCWHFKSAKGHLLENFYILLNGVSCKAYLDTGSELKVARSTVLQKIENISLKTSNIIVKGFGGEILFSKGEAELEF